MYCPFSNLYWLIKVVNDYSIIYEMTTYVKEKIAYNTQKHQKGFSIEN